MTKTQQKFLNILEDSEDDSKLDAEAREKKNDKRYCYLVTTLTVIAVAILGIIMGGTLAWGQCMKGYYLNKRFDTCSLCTVKDCISCPEDKC